MRKVIEYKIVQEFRASDLAISVNEAIQNGWEVWGSMTTASDNSTSLTFCQVMVKFKLREPIRRNPDNEV